MGGKQKKRGVSGNAANYITRNQALKYLQISLKDFRRLSILKGIFPREPKKKVHGKTKTYYLRKDIQFLSHEPILNKFRDLKAFLKKFKRAIGRKDFEVAKRLEGVRPQYTLDHIVKERYPTFVDAVRESDDALCLVHLFALLPQTTDIPHKRVQNCARLAREFQRFVMITHSLRKVFVSVKGIYYQAEIQGQTMTWVVPHTFTQEMPTDVDYRVMMTFLEFYEVLLHFVNYRLYRGLELHYPPRINASKDTRFFAIDAVETSKDETMAPAAPAPADDTTTEEVKERLQSLKDKLNTLDREAENEGDDGEKKDDDEDAGEFGAAMATAEAQAAANLAARTKATVFKGMKMLLGRETPVDSLTFIIKSGGGQIVYEPLDDAEAVYNDMTITHHICDRPVVAHRFLSREYVQPQWVYDSFNVAVALPAEIYTPGVPLPPHLSPFVDDESEGYKPEYREYLDKVVEAASNGQVLPEPPSLEVRTRRVLPTNDNDSDSEDDKKAQAKDESEEGDSDDDDDGMSDDDHGMTVDSDDDDDEIDEDSSEDDDSDAETPKKGKKAEKGGASAKASTDRKRAREPTEAEEEKELAKIMMSKKHKRLYDRMQFGINKKKERNDTLMQKRNDLKQQQSPSSSGPSPKKQHQKTGDKPGGRPGGRPGGNKNNSNKRPNTRK